MRKSIPCQTLRSNSIMFYLSCQLPRRTPLNRARPLAFAGPLYEGQLFATGEPIWPQAIGLIASHLRDLVRVRPAHAAGSVRGA